MSFSCVKPRDPCYDVRAINDAAFPVRHRKAGRFKVKVGTATEYQRKEERQTMPIDPAINYASLDEFSLDPTNPRLGRNNAGRNVTQGKVLDLMSDWNLDELAISFLENGFWPQEALVAIEEDLYGKPALVVVEGNRRLAALMYLRDALNGQAASKRWQEIARGQHPAGALFKKIPYIKLGSRSEVDAFLGFRHVTGIMEWRPAEKAEYIAKLIEKRQMSYEEVMRKIGSKTPTVRQHYISYRLLLQMEDQEDISLEHVEEKFSVLFLSLRTFGVQKYLHIDIKAEPDKAKTPVPPSHLRELTRFALWLFGDKRTPPIVKESRQVDNFGAILESKKAVDYLERSERPNFDAAFRLAGGDEPELIKLIEKAADDIEAALGRAHHYAKSEKLRNAVERVGTDVFQLLRIWPDIKDKVVEDMD